MLRTVRSDDAPSIAEIYNHYVLNSPATFEEVLVSPDEMRQRILETVQAYPWLVCEEDGKLLGFAYGRKWRERAAYRHSVEVSVYLHISAVGKGRGSALLDALLAELRTRPVHCIMAGVSLPNDASVALLEKFGFRPVAHFKEVGNKFGQWIDVGYCSNRQISPTCELANARSAANSLNCNLREARLPHRRWLRVDRHPFYRAVAVEHRFAQRGVGVDGEHQLVYRAHEPSPTGLSPTRELARSAN